MEPSSRQAQAVKRPPGSLVGRNRAHRRHSQEPQWDPENSRIWDISANGDLLPLRALIWGHGSCWGHPALPMGCRTFRRPPGQAVHVESPVPPASCALGEGRRRPALRGGDTKPRVRDLQIGLQKPQKDKAWRWNARMRCQPIRCTPRELARLRKSLREANKEYKQKQAGDSLKRILRGQIC